MRSRWWMSLKLFAQSGGSDVIERDSKDTFRGIRGGCGNIRGERSIPLRLMVDGTRAASVRSQWPDRYHRITEGSWATSWFAYRTLYHCRGQRPRL